MSQLFSKVIQARRASGAQEDDVLQVPLHRLKLYSFDAQAALTNEPVWQCDARTCSPLGAEAINPTSKLTGRCRVHAQVFIDSKYRSAYGGRATTDEEITGFLIATLFAGQHTSSITSSWTGFFMLTNQVQTHQNLIASSCPCPCSSQN